MQTYAELQAQITELQRKADEVKKGEREKARAQILELMQRYGITVDELSAKTRAKSANPRAAVEAKYRDPVSGATWTGRGREPRWLAGRERSTFLIKNM
jgi:DNA-binding protein H-NS